ncbi:putative membrane protein [Bacillus phage vB_BceM_Bc431v3]|uniref:Putative membrane protein n=1 Tax=Bacillus phage vB_BceM_Bc431v3 TaxID=1195072 RepID=M4HQ08_9CAUD|nr:hypothetical protein K201_gp132 [Bacillus phage vB_BceM_Bc431v3]AFQ96440.1 putative membrane protein [Bacillus phage vB_BceM_Bc431v3]
MNKTTDFMLKWFLPICIMIILFSGAGQIIYGSVTVGIIQVFTGFYVATMITPMKMERMVKRYAIWLGVLTVGMIVCLITLLFLGNYFGALSTALVTIAGAFNIYVLHFKHGKEEHKNVR